MPWYGLVQDTMTPLSPEQIQGKADELTEMIVNEHDVNIGTREIIYRAPGTKSPFENGLVAVKIWGDD